MTSFSFVTKKDECKKLELIQTESKVCEQHEDGPAAAAAAVTLDVIKGSFSANNKFYIEFGEKFPMFFFKCYPVDKNATLVETGSMLGSDSPYVHPVVWGVARVSSSNVTGVSVGDEYLAMLPIGESVSFDKVHINEEGNLVVDRPATNLAYNVLQKIHPNNALASTEHGDLALASFPGIITGYHLYFRLTRNGFYGADTVVMTAASSKVSLALALFLKEFKTDKEVRLVGYTSSANKDFCKKTGLYDEVLGYDDLLGERCTKCCMIDVSGQAQTYQQNNKSILKNFVIGNASGTEDKKTTFSSLTTYGSMKLIMTMMGMPSFILNRMNPIQEVYLIPPDMTLMKTEWGLEKYNETMIEYGFVFCKAMEKLITIRRCDTEGSIEQAFVEIVSGTVPPTGAIVLDIVKAVSARKE